MPDSNESLTLPLPDDDPLAGLAALTDARRELDRLERRLIEAARARRISWARIAPALGVTSRQAAEQRWLRLCDQDGRDAVTARASRRRQRTIDTLPVLRELRSAVEGALTFIDTDDAWHDRHPRAALARASLAEAATAPTSALFALAQHAAADLTAIPVTHPALTRLHTALTAATP